MQEDCHTLVPDAAFFCSKSASEKAALERLEGCLAEEVATPGPKSFGPAPRLELGPAPRLEQAC